MDLIEIIWDLFSDVLNDFIFELNNGFLNLLVHGMPWRSQSRMYGRHRSLVRLIGTALPLKPCQRTYSQILYSENKRGSNFRCESEPIEYSNEGPDGIDAWSRDLKSDVPDVIRSMTYSTPKERSVETSRTNEVSAEKFAALQVQVLQLQADIAKILSNQLLPSNSVSTTPSEKNDDKDFRSKLLEDKLEGDAVSSTEDFARLPPKPPPLPPPPPSFFLPPRPPMKSQSLTDEITLYSRGQLNDLSLKRHKTLPIRPGMEEVLKNIGTVKLKHVERSPGGTPLRRRPRSPPRNDPAALLAAALRRRFAHMRPDEPSPERPLLNGSNHRNFSEISPKPFEEIDQISYCRSQDISNLGR